ncbi:MAG: NAD(P)/FAD-dependent oxidoreductase [Woeseiaceae bacterium]|nr:NAD(P)/FAD-dependent oxidoreductase [Woeseiaceae bacterium]
MVNTHYPSSEFDRRLFLKLVGAGALTLSLSACGKRQGGLSGSVVVVGGGLSGLAAAMLLEERGLDVTVVEARDRLGGRIETLDDVPGRPEGGGPVISESYERVMKISAAVGASMGPGPAFERETLLHVGGQSVTSTAWPESVANKLPPAERQFLPPYLLGVLSGRNNPLTDWSDWIDARHAAIDVSLADYLRSNGVSDEALRLINVAPNTNDIETTSALWALRNAQRRRDSKGGRIVTATGGNSRLIERMAAAIQGQILRGKPVIALRSMADRVEVECADGTQLESDYCVVTLPFSVLRGVQVEPQFEGLQREAVEHLPYTAISKYFLVPKAPFWEEDGLPVSMWTDSIIERVFPNRDEEGNVASLTCWVDGANAITLDNLPEEEQIATVLAELGRIRPSTSGMVDVVKTLSWARDPWALGAYAHYAPGQVTRLKPVMSKPWQRLHLAGEHTAVTSPGIESAIESAQRASREIIERLS